MNLVINEKRECANILSLDFFENSLTHLQVNKTIINEYLILPYEL